MKILIINCILSTAEHGVIVPKQSISDCMISTFARGFVELGQQVTLLISDGTIAWYQNLDGSLNSSRW